MEGVRSHLNKMIDESSALLLVLLHIMLTLRNKTLNRVEYSVFLEKEPA